MVEELFAHVTLGAVLLKEVAAGGSLLMKGKAHMTRIKEPGVLFIKSD